jgi:hypothetical protein
LRPGIYPFQRQQELPIVTDKKWDGTRTVTLDSAPDEMERIGSHLFTAAVPFDADPEFKAYIMAAGTTHAMGNRSIDNILRRHCDKWIKHFEEQEISDAKGLVGLRRAVVRQATARCVEISNLDLGEDARSGTTSAANVLIRLDSSFRAASHLLQLGFAFESEAVIRVGFEQVAWSNVVRHLQSSKEVTKVSGTGNITKLKEIFPGAGFIYGRLSDMAHLSPRTHSLFMLCVFRRWRSTVPADAGPVFRMMPGWA